MAPHAGKRASLTVAPGQCKPSGERFHSSRARPRRRALPTTDTELRLIASAAIVGLSSRPVNGYSTPAAIGPPSELRSEEHPSELQSLMRNSYAVFCLKNKTDHQCTITS